jgi:predicted dehydrogenase
MINIGIIGFGYWGPNVARNFHASGDAKLIAVSDLSEKRLGIAAAHYPFIRTSKNAIDVIRAADIDAVAVATPVSSHYELAKEALLAGKHVFVEKPFTSNSDQAQELVDLADKKGLKIMVDHTVLFTGAVKKLKQIIESGELGRLLFYDSVRVNLGLFQHDVNVIWDLAPHDLSVMDYLIKAKPVAVTVHGSVHYKGGFQDIAYISIDFEDDGFIAHFHVNWLSPVKIRRTLISGDMKMLVYDDLSADEKVKVYDRGIDIKRGGRDKNGIHELLVSYRSGDASIPKLDVTEALLAEAKYFVQCLEKNQEPFNNGRTGLRIVQFLEAADKSLKQGGRKIEL